METTLLLIILIALALVLVLLVYVVDRLMALEKLTLNIPGFGPDESKGPAGNGDMHFGALTGQQLWEGMNGKPVEGWTADTFHALRPRYEVVLGKHIEQIFNAGKNGNALPPNPATIETLRGSVASFIPGNHAQTLYNLGARSAQEPAEALANALDDVTEILYGRTGLDLRRPYSEKLLGFTGDPTPNAEDGEAGVKPSEPTPPAP
jgi:hypothetical protein